MFCTPTLSLDGRGYGRTRWGYVGGGWAGAIVLRRRAPDLEQSLKRLTLGVLLDQGAGQELLQAFPIKRWRQTEGVPEPEVFVRTKRNTLKTQGVEKILPASMRFCHGTEHYFTGVSG